MNISDENIINGINNTKWPYRLQKIDHGKIFEILPKDSVFYIDGAHNISGAKVISDFLKNEKNIDNIDNYIINGRTKDTDSKNYLMQFKGTVNLIVAIRGKLEGLPESPYVIQKSAHEIGMNCIIGMGIIDAVKKIILYHHNIAIDDENLENFDSKNYQNPLRICICGSFYLARDLKFEEN